MAKKIKCAVFVLFYTLFCADFVLYIYFIISCLNQNSTKAH